MYPDINGRIPKIGDLVWRKSGYAVLELIKGFSKSGNLILYGVTKTYNKTLGTEETLYNRGYMTTTQYIIIDTPSQHMLTDAQLSCVNKERQKLGLSPLRRYGNT